MNPFLPFWPLFLTVDLTGIGGFTLYPHAYHAPWVEFITAAGEMFSTSELGAAGAMIRSPWGGGMIWVYGPSYFRTLGLRIGRGWGDWGIGGVLTVRQIEGETPIYTGQGWVSGEIGWPSSVLFWAFGVSPGKAEAHATFWVSEGPFRMALQGSWAEEFLGSVGLVWHVHPSVEVGWGYQFQRQSVGWMMRIFQGSTMGITVSAKIHPDLPISTALILGWRGRVFEVPS